MRRSTMILAVAIAATLASNSLGAPQTKSATPGKAAPLAIGKFVYEGGDGSSIEKAVIIKNAKSETEGIEAESKWIDKVHPGCKKGEQSLLHGKGRDYDRIEYTTPKGELKTIYFDITDFFGK